MCVIALICIILAVVINPGTTEYECTLNDIRECEKCGGGVYADIHMYDIGLEDYMSLGIAVDHKLNDDECNQLEALGLEIHRTTWIPPIEGHPYGFYFAQARVEDICRFSDSNLIVRIESAAMEVEEY